MGQGQGDQNEAAVQVGDDSGHDQVETELATQDLLAPYLPPMQKEKLGAFQVVGIGEVFQSVLSLGPSRGRRGTVSVGQ